MRKNFELFVDAVDFARLVKVPNVRSKPLSLCTADELTAIREKREWILGIRMSRRLGIDTKPVHSDLEFACIQNFRKAFEELRNRPMTWITGFYCYQLSTEPGEVAYINVPVDEGEPAHA